MTIYTRQNLENDEKKGETTVEVEFKVDQTAVPEKPAFTRPSFRHLDANVGRTVRRERRRQLCLQIFLLFGILLGLSISLMGTLYLFRNSSSKSYSGWCGVKYTPKYSSLEGKSTTTKISSYLGEQVTIDDDIETLEVPEYDDKNEATFVLDFYQEVTLIKDFTDKICYFVPLDTEKVPPPSSFLDLLIRLLGGDFVPSAEELRRDYRVVQPELFYKDVALVYGESFANQCTNFTSYDLIEVSEEEVQTTALPTTTSFVVPLIRQYGMYAGGDFIHEYRVFN